MFGPINRAQPALDVTAYKTYAMTFPRSTHTRPATCAEVNCPAYLNGWKTVVPAAGPQADYIRSRSQRRYTMTVGPDGLATFEFEAGQRCFASDQHRVRLDRAPLFTVRGGDWRAVTSPVRKHTRAEFWVEDFALNQQAIIDAQKKGMA